MKLTNPTIEQLENEFAARVVGYTPPFLKSDAPANSSVDYFPYSKVDSLGHTIPCFPLNFSSVLAWMESNFWKWSRTYEGFLQSDSQPSFRFDVFCPGLNRHGYHIDYDVPGATPKAAVIALLRAHGVEVEFTHEN